MKKYRFIGTVFLLVAVLFLNTACHINTAEANPPLSKEEAINIALEAIPQIQGTPGIEKVELFSEEIDKNKIEQDENGWHLKLRILLTVENKEYVNTVSMYVRNDGSIDDFQIASDMTELSIYRGIDGE